MYSEKAFNLGVLDRLQFSQHPWATFIKAFIPLDFLSHQSILEKKSYVLFFCVSLKPRWGISNIT